MQMPDLADTKVTPVPDPKLRVYWPISARFREEIANQESRGSGGYRAFNKSGALGAYQLTPVALEDIGWRGKNGIWNEASGVTSDEEFLNNPLAQEIALKEFLRRNRELLGANGFNPPVGQTVHGIEGNLIVTEDGLAAAMHRAGAPMVKRYLKTLASQNWVSDESQWPEEQRPMIRAIEDRLRDFADIPYLRQFGH
jgi:hypothetical protein